MLRHLFIFSLFIASQWPNYSIAARLELRANTTAQNASVLQVGDELDVEIWIDSENQPLSGAAVFLSFDPAHFTLVDTDRQPILGGFQPFLPGSFLRNGETFRNDLLAENDPGSDLSGIQLDYSVVRAADEGHGVLATFRLRALAPTRNSAVRIDENGLRETRVFKPDGTQTPFRFIAPLNIAIQGISIHGLPPQLILARGQIDSTSFHLNDLVFDPLHSAEAIQWHISPATGIGVQLDQQTQIVTLNAPTDASSWEQLIFTATNPEGQSASDTIDVFVNAAPNLETNQYIRFAEDEPYQIQLDALANDPDTPIDQLDWTFTSSSEIAVTISGPPYYATFTPQTNWYGATTVQIHVKDNFDFADSTQLALEITPVNDPPRLPNAPNIRLIAGKTDSSLTLENLITDPDHNLVDLLFTWSSSTHIHIESKGGHLHLSAPLGWHGSEEILLRVEDPTGQSATTPLTVLVVESLPPALIDPPARLGLVAGNHLVLDLQQFALDPDDQTKDLQWRINTPTNLGVHLHGHAARIEAPLEFTGTEVLSFTVTDPSGSEATFEVLFFAAAASGAPTFAPLPQITMPIDGIDTSIDLDDFVFDPDHSTEQLEWISPELGDILVRIDPVTHILTLSPTPTALPGILSLELHLRDPDGHEVQQTLSIILLSDIGASTFSLSTISDISLAADQTFSISLDTLVEGSVQVDQLQWQIDSPLGIIVDFDAATRTANLRRSDSFIDTVSILFTATALDGQTFSQRANLLYPNISPDIPLSLATLPVLSIAAGAFDNSLDLDDFIHGTNSEIITWEVENQVHTRILIDPLTHVLVVLADEDWYGNESVLLKGKDPHGNVTEGILQIQITAPVSPLALQEIYKTNLFAGDTNFLLPLDQLIMTASDISTLTWQADSDQVLEISYDAATNVLNLQAAVPWQDDDIILLTALDPEGNQATTHILVHALPLDGSTGLTSPEFYLVVVPNVLQPDFLDIFVLSDTELADTPRLRLKENTWNDLTLHEHATGIWSSRHVLNPSQEGNFTLLALGLNTAREALKTELDFFIGTVAKRQSKYLNAGNLHIDLPIGAFADKATIAILPTTMPPINQELVARSPAYLLHSPQPYQGNGATLSIDLPPNGASQTGIYRWDVAHQQWKFSGATQNANAIHVALAEFGLYALFSDYTAPTLLITEDTPGHSRFRWADAGSGIGIVKSYINDILLSDTAISWQDDWLEINTQHLAAGTHTLRLQISDQAGNQTTIEKRLHIVGNRPQTFSLGQNFPNPFNPSTTIPLFIAAPSTAAVRLNIYNTTGQRVRHLLNRSLAPGNHHIVWDARHDNGRPLASGTYIYQLEIDGHLQSRKLLLAR